VSVSVFSQRRPVAPFVFAQVSDTVCDCCVFLGGATPVLSVLWQGAVVSHASLSAGRWEPLEAHLCALKAALAYRGPEGERDHGPVRVTSDLAQPLLAMLLGLPEACTPAGAWEECVFLRCRASEVVGLLGVWLRDQARADTSSAAAQVTARILTLLHTPALTILHLRPTLSATSSTSSTPTSRTETRWFDSPEPTPSLTLLALNSFSFFVQSVWKSVNGSAARALKTLCEQCGRELGEPVLALYDQVLKQRGLVDSSSRKLS
jgi:hypothetical protein